MCFILWKLVQLKLCITTNYVDRQIQLNMISIATLLLLFTTVHVCTVMHSITFRLVNMYIICMHVCIMCMHLFVNMFISWVCNGHTWVGWIGFHYHIFANQIIHWNPRVHFNIGTVVRGKSRVYSWFGASYSNRVAFFFYGIQLFDTEWSVLCLSANRYMDAMQKHMNTYVYNYTNNLMLHTIAIICEYVIP